MDLPLLKSALLIGIPKNDPKSSQKLPPRTTTPPISGQIKDYFRGGYTIKTHGSGNPGGKRPRGEVDAIQIEVPKKHRFGKRNRTEFSGKLSKAIEEFWNKYYK